MLLIILTKAFLIFMTSKQKMYTFMPPSTKKQPGMSRPIMQAAWWHPGMERCKWNISHWLLAASIHGWSEWRWLHICFLESSGEACFCCISLRCLAFLCICPTLATTAVTIHVVRLEKWSFYPCMSRAFDNHFFVCVGELMALIG